jgi:hypothetical protein
MEVVLLHVRYHLQLLSGKHCAVPRPVRLGLRCDDVLHGRSARRLRRPADTESLF